MMEPTYSLASLFEQLGLPSGEQDIDGFIAQYSLSNEVRLAEAPFWTPAQAGFIQENMLEDSDWAPIIDELNVRLHA